MEVITLTTLNPGDKVIGHRWGVNEYGDNCLFIDVVRDNLTIELATDMFNERYPKYQITIED